MLTGLVTFVISFKSGQQTSIESSENRNNALKVATLSMMASMVHVFCDLIAGGSTWPVYPYWPISDFDWSVSWSWSLAQWPNTLILFSCLAAMILYAKLMGYSPLESINYKLDKVFVTIIQKGSSIQSKNSLKVRFIIYSLLILLIIAILAPLGFQLEQVNIPKL